MADAPKNLSIAEYFKLKGLRDAKRIEVTYEDGSKVAIEGLKKIDLRLRVFG